jgi:hypothetical protein
LTGPSPVDRGRTGSKHHLIVDPSGIPLAATPTGGNRNDVTQLLAGSIGAAVVGRYRGEGKIDSVRPARSSSSRSA